MVLQHDTSHVSATAATRKPHTPRQGVRLAIAAALVVALSSSVFLLAGLAAYAWYRRALADCVEWGNTYRLMD